MSMTMRPRHTSTMTLKGKVAAKSFTAHPSPKLILLISNDDNHPQQQQSTGSPSNNNGKPSSTVLDHGSNGNSTHALRTSSSATVQHHQQRYAHHAAAKNVIEFRLEKEWATSCSFITEGDSMEVEAFDVFDLDSSGGIQHQTSTVSSDPGLATFTQASTHGVHHEAQAMQTPFFIAPCRQTSINIGRTQTVVINLVTVRQAASANQVSSELTLREKPLSSAVGDTPASRLNQQQPMTEINGMCNVQRYFDVIRGLKSHFNANAQFVERLAAGKRNILDVGCGTGLYSFFLRYCGGSRPPVCVDKSRVMQAIIAEKNALLVPSSSSSANNQQDGAMTGQVPFVLGDISSPEFSLVSNDENGSDSNTNFDLILCIDVLSYLPSTSAIRMALRNMFLHLAPGGTLLLSVPNFDHWATLLATQGTTQRAFHYDFSREQMSVGATASLGRGVLDVIERIQVAEAADVVAGDSSVYWEGVNEGKSSSFAKATQGSALGDEDPALKLPHPGSSDELGHILCKRTSWFGMALHQGRSGGSYETQTECQPFEFNEIFREVVVTPALLEDMLDEVGFRVHEVYASLSGSAVLETQRSERIAVRVYHLSKPSL